MSTSNVNSIGQSKRISVPVIVGYVCSLVLSTPWFYALLDYVRPR